MRILFKLVSTTCNSLNFLTHENYQDIHVVQIEEIDNKSRDGKSVEVVQVGLSLSKM